MCFLITTKAITPRIPSIQKRILRFLTNSSMATSNLYGPAITVSAPSAIDAKSRNIRVPVDGLHISFLLSLMCELGISRILIDFLNKYNIDVFSANKGFLDPRQIIDLKSLVFSEEERDILSWLHRVTSKYLFFNKVRLFFLAFYTFLTIAVFVLADWVVALPRDVLVFIFILFVILSIFVYVVSVMGSSKMMNIYTRIIKSIFDNILQSIYDTHTVSLAHLISKFPKAKVFSADLATGGLASANYYSSIAQILGTFAGLLFAFFYGFWIQDTQALIISGYGIFAIFLFIGFMWFGKGFSDREALLSRFSDITDEVYNDRHALLFSGKKLMDQVEWKRILEGAVGYTTYVNLTSAFVTYVVPVFLVFYPFFYGGGSSFFIVTSACLFITMKIFGQTLVVSHYNAISVADLRSNQLRNLFDTVKKVGAELTSERYEIMKRKLKTEGRRERLDGFVIESLKYVVGRGENEREVWVGNTKLSSGSVHFLYGKSGSGKSIFGRVLTLRYADFKAKKLLLNGKDIRNYANLQEGLSRLHFSSLRFIPTSYRHAISIYLDNKSSAEGLIEYVMSLGIDQKEVKIHFEKNQEYYGGLNFSEFDHAKPERLLKDLNAGDFAIISDMLKNLSFGKKVDKNVFWVACMFEYAAFNYLKQFIGDANLYFMDAVLSEPPISQGQRRRVLLALDLLIKGDVFVADEPFANLDDKNSANILKLLKDYAIKNNAVVVVLDQKERLSGMKKVGSGKRLRLMNNKVGESA